MIIQAVFIYIYTCLLRVCIFGYKILQQNIQQTLKAPGVMKEMLLWSRERDLREGRVPKALSDKNLSLFLSRLMAEASHGNSLGSSARPERSQSTLQLFSCVQVQDGGQARTQAHRASTSWGSRQSTETERRTGWVLFQSVVVLSVFLQELKSLVYTCGERVLEA